MNFLKKQAWTILAILLASCSVSWAQPTLPEIGIVTQGGISVISWNNPYEKNNIKSIAVQRSADSNYNYATIGFVENLQKGVQSYIDANPMPGKNWYRLLLVFSSDMEWRSNLGAVSVDSADIANRKPMLPTDSLQKLIQQTGSSGSNISSMQTITYPKSQYVFTNPFTGNITIELADALKENYVLVFYDTDDKEVLRVPRVNDKVVILDKRNFQRSGLYKFKLFKNQEEFDKGYVTIY